METKQCTLCTKTKTVDQFKKLARNKDGLNCWCKDCSRQKDREQYEARKNNSEKKHSDAKKCSICKEDRAIDNFNKFAGSNDGYASQCKPCIRQYKRRVNGFDQMGYIPDNYWNILIKVYGEKCLKCGHDGTGKNFLTLDHVIPISHGTEETKLHDINNFQILCHKCNSGKQATVADYRPRLLTEDDFC